jgi:hypothetical protein
MSDEDLFICRCYYIREKHASLGFAMEDPMVAAELNGQRCSD